MTMKPDRTIALWALLLLATAAATAQQSSGPQQDPDQTAKKPAAVAARTKPGPTNVTLPAGAVLTSPGTFSYTDADGKKWIYRQTPFGMVKFEDRAATAGEDDTKKIAANIQATEEGDYIRFERPSPFGTYKWKQKKTELGPLEQAAWDQAREKQKSAREKE